MNPNDLIKLGVEAQGGADALRNIKTLVQKGDAKHWEPGQSYSVNGESRFLGDSTVTVTVDYNNPVRVRYDWDRDMKYPAVEKLKYSEIRYPTYGAVDRRQGRGQADVGDPAGDEHPRRRPRLAEAAAACPGIAAERFGDRGPEARRPDLARGGLHPGTRPSTSSCSIAPRSCRWRCARATKTTSGATPNYDVILSDWKTVNGGVKIAHSRSFKLNDMEVQRINYKDVTVNPTAPARRPSRSPMPSRRRRSRRRPATCPTSGCMRRLFLGRFTDSDKIYFPDERQLQAGRALAQRPDGSGRRRQQPDRQHEGRHRRRRRADR